MNAFSHRKVLLSTGNPTGSEVGEPVSPSSYRKSELEPFVPLSWGADRLLLQESKYLIAQKYNDRRSGNCSWSRKIRICWLEAVEGHHQTKIAVRGPRCRMLIWSRRHRWRFGGTEEASSIDEMVWRMLHYRPEPTRRTVSTISSFSSTTSHRRNTNAEKERKGKERKGKGRRVVEELSL